eukprot:201081-Pleurochrysis_carterae.AAC.1
MPSGVRCLPLSAAYVLALCVSACRLYVLALHACLTLVSAFNVCVAMLQMFLSSKMVAAARSGSLRKQCLVRSEWDRSGILT